MISNPRNLGRGGEGLGRESTVGKRVGGLLCVRGRLQAGQYSCRVNAKAHKALWERACGSRTLGISISDSQ